MPTEVTYGRVYTENHRHSEQTQEQVSFPFRPRQMGKNSLIANQIQDDVKLSWSLLNTRVRRRCQSDPGVLRDEIETRGVHDGLVIIDGIQKDPELLDEVHLLIEETDIRFILTGSSARRLKEQGVNLLGGRAGKMNLHPFVWPEIRESARCFPGSERLLLSKFMVYEIMVLLLCFKAGRYGICCQGTGLGIASNQPETEAA